MTKSTDRPPVLRFALAFVGLIVATLCLAALPPAPELAGSTVSASDDGHAAIGAQGDTGQGPGGRALDAIPPMPPRGR